MSASTPTRPKRSRTSSSLSVRRSVTVPKTEVTINVYDLLPPGRLSSFLWTIGGSLLHSGVVINGREYAYGGHNRRNTTGVYYTKPRLEPPGGTFRCNILQGFTFRTQAEIDNIIRSVSEQFLGERYNLLSNNCNHFTNALCERLTGKYAPGWLNRAAGIGLALPCMVPSEWVNPPDAETADGELVEDEEDDDERAAMLQSDRRRRGEHRRQESALLYDNLMEGGTRVTSEPSTPPARLVNVRDTSGRKMPAAERAPMPSSSKR
ncbi:hypothetical protein BAUCODRAFT_100381 [Baudoinia panamericana UAMH 10762]|uniref:PPPDE domain-containing protein n=1 Tax=Baudoinia panamericana (strain UAMH 10762) TaxID=717646 RepID=M2M1B6_BAUPA|nr:uncharacterized protein BAUCODRAFT_100381 [Baudoinia panamericana UAMH 10762]EMD00843.1 hypothetical protein BAUCODRAFT_100381 [Baudoinia panamericana UAMH 10762]